MEEEGADAKEEEATKNLLRLVNPDYWNLNIEGNVETELEKGYNELIFTMQAHTSNNPEDLSVMQFYSLIEHIKQKPQATKK